jgi:hypothetical protein
MPALSQQVEDCCIYLCVIQSPRLREGPVQLSLPWTSPFGNYLRENGVTYSGSVR